jgi:membrane-bound serine protease (ClpP class)
MSDHLLTVVSLLAGGLLLVAIEVCVIPGIGVVGIAGGALLLVGSALTWAWFGAVAGAVALLCSAIGPALLSYAFARTHAGKRLVLSSALPRKPASAPAVQVGQAGRALTPLRPAGSAQFGDSRCDVVTDGTYLDAGEPLRVVEVAGARVVVEKDLRPTENS